MRLRGILWGLLLGVSSLQGCTSFSPSDTGVEHRLTLADSEFSCGNLDQYQCFAYEEALTALINSSDPKCVELGYVAAGAPVHFDETTSDYGYVLYLGASDIYLGALAFSGGELMNTLVHEAVHTLGFDDSDAYPLGERCDGEW